MRRGLVMCCLIKPKAAWEGEKLKQVYGSGSSVLLTTERGRGCGPPRQQSHPSVEGMGQHPWKAGWVPSTLCLSLIHPSIHPASTCQQSPRSQALWIEPRTREKTLRTSPAWEEGHRHLTIIRWQGIIHLFKCNNSIVVIFHKRALLLQRYIPKYLQMK